MMGRFYRTFLLLSVLLPGIGFRGCATWAGKYLIQRFERLRAQRQFQTLHGARQLLHRAGSDDGGRDDRLVKQPGERHSGRRGKQRVTESFVGNKFFAVEFNVLFNVFARPTAR